MTEITPPEARQSYEKEARRAIRLATARAEKAEAELRELQKERDELQKRLDEITSKVIALYEAVR